MQYINLYQDQFKPQRHMSMLAIVSALLLGMLALMAVLAWYQQYSGQSLRQRLAIAQSSNQNLMDAVTAMEEKLANRQPSALLQKKLIRLREQLRQRQPLRLALEHELAQEDVVPLTLTALARRPLHKLWLSKVELNSAGLELQLQGVALQPANVPVFVEQLAQQQEFANKHFEQLQLERRKDGLYKFVLSTTMEAGQ
ncbi:MAG: hypothetical protein B6I36_07740 [Desulfobacteraceae bacterium 4572_35.1]|nr:MAG: hypothetical protein B6I36_07740 [Desulfobacteraceae bacterium 4572_35.1]